LNYFFFVHRLALPVYRALASHPGESLHRLATQQIILSLQKRLSIDICTVIESFE